MERIDKDWIERYVKIYKHFDLLQSFPFDNKEDIEWLIVEMKKKKEGTLTKEKENLFEYLDGFDWNVYDVVMKDRKKEDDSKLSLEFEMKNSRDEDSFRKKRKMNEECEKIGFHWEYDRDIKYSFKDIEGEIHLKIKIKNPWIESVKHNIDTHYYLLYENERILNEQKDSDSWSKTCLDHAIASDLIESRRLNNLEKNLLGITEKDKLIRNSNYRMYEYLFIPIYKKNQKKIILDEEKKERYQEFCKRKEIEKMKKDMNLFLKYYFYDEL